MSTNLLTGWSRYPDALDTRQVFKAYAIAAWCVGALLFLWPPRWAWPVLVGQPYGGVVLARVIGAIVMAAGCFAYPLVDVADPQARRRALAWFAGGHAVVLAILGFQLWAVFEEPSAGGRVAVMTLFATVLVLWESWRSAEGYPFAGLPRHGSLFGDPEEPSVQQLRSSYEEQIRAAASQEERNRLARDLHDSIKQQIFAIQTSAATAQARFETDRAGASAAIEQVRASARDAMTEMEVMLDQLRAAPLENTGLVEALKKQCDTLGFRTGADVRFSVGALPPNESLPPGAQQAVFRVAQEALANVARHARARHVTVSLDSTAYSLQLRVEDDGAGFEQEQQTGGMGLGNMRSRAAACSGTLSIRSRPGEGTLVRVSVPRRPDSPEDLKLYGRRALLFGALLALMGAMSVGVLTHNADWDAMAFQIPALVLLAVPFARSTATYFRLRRRRNAS